MSPQLATLLALRAIGRKAGHPAQTEAPVAPIFGAVVARLAEAAERTPRGNLEETLTDIEIREVETDGPLPLELYVATSEMGRAFMADHQQDECTEAAGGLPACYVDDMEQTEALAQFASCGLTVEDKRPGQGASLSDEQALDAIQALMDRNEWDADTHEGVAALVNLTDGRKIRKPEPTAKPVVWLLTEENESGNYADFENHLILGAYNSQEAANKAWREWRAEHENGRATAHAFTIEGNDEPTPEELDAEHWCSTCGLGVEVSSVEVYK
jgi:hypothetical protein